MKIEVNDWKEFRIGDLFDVYLSKDDIQPKHLQEGDTPLISSGKEKNGVVAYITDDNAKLWDANTLTVDMFGKVFYQNSPYYCVSHGRVNILYPKTKLNEKVLQFVASVIEQVSANKYDFADMCTAGKIKNDVIFLPATPSGSPDWDYMEAYMKEMEEKAKERLNRLEEMRKQEKKRIDVSGWGKFHLYDLFDISMGNKFDKSKMNTFEDDVNFVGRSALNNGVACSVSFVKDKNGEDITPYKAGDVTIALGGSIGSCFIQDRDFYTSQNVCVLINDDMNEYVKKFIVTSIYASCANYEAFVDELNRHIKTDFIIKLPVTSDGAPDWAYMEQYMREMEEKAKKRLKRLFK